LDIQGTYNKKRYEGLFMRIIYLCGILLFGSVSLNAIDCQLPIDRRLSQEKIRSYMDTIQGLRYGAAEHFRQAEELCWYLPQGIGRETVRAAIVSAAAACVSGSWPRAAGVLLVGTIGNYMGECWDTYMEITDHVNTANKCMEVADSLSSELARKEQDSRWLQ
jgi:hypothetical protein